MKVSPEYLPSELHYIIPLVERHGSEARVAHFNARLGRHVEYAETLKPVDLGPLKELYAEIRDKGHCSVINRWHERQSGNDSCPSETTWPVYGLLYLFRQLGNLGIDPFNDGAVGPKESQTAKALDWVKLPPSLLFLAEPAEVYGELQFDERIYEFLDEQMTPDQQSELKALSRRCGLNGETIERWLDEYPMTEHPEASLVYFTLHLLAIGSDLELL